MKWQAVFFDLDDTLYSRADAFARTTRRFSDRFVGPGIDVDFDSIQAGVVSRIKDESKGVGQDRHWQLVFEIIKERHPEIEPTATELVAWYRDELIAQMQPDPGLQRVLDHLRSTGTPHGVITNGDLFQLRKIDQLDIGIPRDRIVMSDVEGVRKPDPEIFAIAAERLAVEASPRVLMIGDNPEADVAGAKSAGMTAAWMTLDRSWEYGEPRPDIRLSSLRDLIDHL